MKTYSQTPIPAEENTDSSRLKRCSRCGTVGYQDDLYCPRCGASFEASCWSCSAAVTHPVAFFCVRCGERLCHTSAVGVPSCDGAIAPG